MTDYWWLLVVIWLGQINFSLWLIWLFGSDHQLQDAFISWRMLPDLVLFGLLDSCDCFKWLFCWCRRVGRCGLVFNGCPRNAPSSSRQEFRAMASIEVDLGSIHALCTTQKCEEGQACYTWGTVHDVLGIWAEDRASSGDSFVQES